MLNHIFKYNSISASDSNNIKIINWLKYRKNLLLHHHHHLALQPRVGLGWLDNCFPKSTIFHQSTVEGDVHFGEVWSNVVSLSQSGTSEWSFSCWNFIAQHQSFVIQPCKNMPILGQYPFFKDSSRQVSWKVFSFLYTFSSSSLRKILSG